MAYATLTDLVTSGLPATALGNLTVAQQQAALDEASEQVDSYYRGRYSLPLATWDSATTQATCRIAVYNLVFVRGYNPAVGADPAIRDRYVEAKDWLARVQRQAAHPNVTSAVSQTPNYNQPMVISSSVTSLGNGATTTNRGW